MSRIVLTEELRTEYGRLFAACDIRPERAAEVDALADGLLADWGRYHAVGGRLKIPWFAVAVLHYAATGHDFEVHPHNGDPLSDRTRHVPDGRPLDGEPPFAWEASAADALRLWHVDRWEDWSIAGTLFALEGRGGWGYRLNHPEVPSPYLWNYSTHYTQGKYVTDDSWSDTAISRRCGVAVLLRRLAERGSVEFAGERAARPMVRYSRADVSPAAEALQLFLNTLPGIFVKVDGIAGPRTSEAFHKLCGRYLLGDPRDGGEGQ